MIRFDQKVIADAVYIGCVVVTVSNSAGYDAHLAPGTMPTGASPCCTVGGGHMAKRCQSTCSR